MFPLFFAHILRADTSLEMEVLNKNRRYSNGPALRRVLLSMLLGLGVIQSVVAQENGVRAGDGTLVRIALIGDTGYIPAYETVDEDEHYATLDEYVAAEAADWIKKNGSLGGFVVSPWVFESATGSFMPASGLYPVARAAEEVCKTEGCDFGVLLGDNIYPDGATLGSDGISDARRFTDMLDRPYGRFGADTPGFTLYTLLGNHDWYHSREGAVAQLEYLRRHPHFTMPDFFYRSMPERFAGEVELFVIDTQMLLASTVVYEDKLDADGREIRHDERGTFKDFMQPATDAERNMVAWLESALASSTARWKIVVGHHALWSGGGSKFEKARALRKLLMPALCRYADAYIAGDDHVLEAYTDRCEGARPPLPLIVSGAGAKRRALNTRFIQHQLADNPELTQLWSKGSIWGFAHLRLQGDVMQVDFFTTPSDSSGRPVLERRLEFQRRSAP